VVGASPWAAEFRRQLRVAFGSPPNAPSLRLVAFEQVDRRLAQRNLDRTTVLDELRNGIVNMAPEESSNPGRPRYRITTARLEVNLHNEPQAHGPGNALLAVLDNASFRSRNGKRSIDPYARFSPAAVTLSEPRDGSHCDLRSLTEVVERHRLVAEAEHALAGLRLNPRRQSALRAEARKKYGSLRSLLELGRQRAECGDGISAAGTVVRGADALGATSPLANELVISLKRPGRFAAGEGDRLSVRPSRDDSSAQGPPASFQLELLELTDEAVVLSWPEREAQAAKAKRILRSGTEVVVTESDEFRYQRHLAAVRDFLDERNVAGNWAALATLLCDPAALPVPDSLPDIAPDRRPLNPAQRDAVARGLAAPYACFVQGPPGTGKTQVIAETIARLIQRGERVLLTAPTHVALDEVLRRLLEDPDVLPLRLTWKDSLVDKRVRHLTQSGYDHVLADDLRTPASSEMPVWKARLAAVRRQRMAITAWQESTAERPRAENDLASARSNLAEGDRRRDAEYARMRAWLTQVHQAADSQLALTARLRHDYAAAESHLESIEATASGWLRALALAGLGRLSKARRQEQRVRHELSDAETRLPAALQERDNSQAVESRTVAGLSRERRTDTDALARAEELSAQARERAATAWAELTALQLDYLATAPERAPRLLAGLQAEDRDLASRIAVQQRWFDLTGMSGEDDEADRRSGKAVIGPAMAGAVNLLCVTTTGFGGDPAFRDLDFDTLVVDEASKVTGAEFLIPARRAHRWIMVGDERQLPPYVEPRDEHHVHAMAALHLTERDTRISLHDAVERLASLWADEDDTEAHPFRNKSVEETAERLLKGGTWENAHRKIYQEQIRHLGGNHGTEPERALLRAMHEHQVTSLFERCVRKAPGGLCRPLIEQRRMNAPLAELVRLPVYQGNYKTPPNLPAECEPLRSVSFPTPLTLLDTSTQRRPWHTQEGTTCFNTLEADWVAKVCASWNRALTHRNADKVSVSVLAFYGAQARLIRNKLGYPHYPEYGRLDFKVVDSVDRIQGQEADLVIVSFCRTWRPGRDHRPPPPRYGIWLQNINRLNVASTRARRAVVLIGHADTLRQLSGVPAAEAYYDNLFRLLASGSGTLLNDIEV
jgi:hypothetical protein